MRASGTLVAVGASLLMLTACTSGQAQPDPVPPTQTGGPQITTPSTAQGETRGETTSPGPTTSPPAADGWTGSWVMDYLARSPAEAREYMIFVDAAALIAVDQFSDDPAPTTGELPPSQFLWVGRAGASVACDRAFNQAFRLDAVTFLGTPQRRFEVGSLGLTNSMSVCDGGVIMTEPVGDEVLLAGQTWDTQGPHLVTATGARVLATGVDVDPATVEQFVDGPAPEGSLADDPDVRAVLAHTDEAAVLVMGTFLTKPENENWPDATERIAPRFGGYGWTADPESVLGTTVFVTTYDTEADAAEVAATLTGIWSSADPPKKFAGAVTTVDGTTVVTSVPEVELRTFSLVNMGYVDYPAF